MQREILFDRVEAFIEELERLGISVVVFAETREKRVKQFEKEVRVVDLALLELIAYRDSTIYKCVMEDVDFDEIFGLLEQRGFSVTRRSRNIT